jgi:hypothetical protein
VRTSALLPAAAILLGALAGPSAAEEGMWTLDNPPLQRIARAYGRAPDTAWLDHAMHASARLAAGCSGSFVSPEGLVLSNHHCVARCVEQLSTSSHPYMGQGFVAARRAEERQCPAMEVDRLESITDVTADMVTATAGRDGAAYKQARVAAQARLTSACVGAEAARVRCDVVDLYHGGQYKLYRYHRFQDVRLVFAPEKAIAFFGGDPDNFNFPRYDLDMSLLRVYEDGRPASVKEFFPFRPEGPRAGEAVFVVGHPGATQRQLTVAQLDTLRTLTLPRQLLRLAEYRGVLETYIAADRRHREEAGEALFTVENTLKALTGRFEALQEPAFQQRRQADESALRAFVDGRIDLKANASESWNAIAQSQRRLRELYRPLVAIEWGNPFLADLFPIARTLVRGTAERARPNAERLPEYADAALPEVEARLFSPAPIHRDFEKLRLAFALTKLRESLGADHALVRLVLGQESPEQLAARLVDGTRLSDPAFRRHLWEGGSAAVAASQDPLLRFAAGIDVQARALRRLYEAEVESVVDKNSERIARARFARDGTDTYPDATFTLRLSYGQVAGWQEQGAQVEPFTRLGGLFERATGADPFRLPERWLAARPHLDPATPMNFVTTNDIIGGNSGSPVVDAAGRLVGLIFDGNIHSLGGAFSYDGSNNRAVAVDAAAMLEALNRVYMAPGLAAELRGP